MEYRTLGNDLTVSAVGLGCMGMSHAYGAPANKKEMAELLAQAVGMGYTFFDTAEVYGTPDNPHDNEELVGAALKPYRDKIVLATKFGIHFDMTSTAVNKPLVPDSRPEVIRASVDGDIFFTRFDNAIGSEQSGNRPAVVLQNDVGNFYSPTRIVATLTSKAAKKYTQPTHCLLVNEFLSVPSIVQAEQIFTVDKSSVLKFLGHLTPEEMSRVDDAVRASLALNPMGSIQRLPPIIRSTAAYAPPEVIDGKPPLYS